MEATQSIKATLTQQHTLRIVDPSNPPPVWEEDGHDSPECYEEHMVGFVKDAFQQSVDYYWKKKARWKDADRIIELEHLLDDMLDAHPSRSKLPIIPQAVEEWLAARHSEYLRPQASSRQPQMDQLVGALDYFADQELDGNYYNILCLRRMIDQIKFRIAFWRVDVDPKQSGPFGHQGRHIISRVDPRDVWPDPYSDSWRWEDMKYVIIARVMDCAEICRQWPDRGFLVEPDVLLSGTDKDAAKHSAIASGSEAARPYHERGNRKRAMVLEMYVKDYQQRAVPLEMPDGMLYPGAFDKTWDSDDDHEFVDRYPGGRLIVVAGDVLLRDSANPYNHGLPPIVAFPESQYDGMFSYSPLELLSMVERKINLLVREAFSNLRVHLNNQWVIDRNAFTKPSQFQNIAQDPKQIFIVRPGSRIMRLPPGELPQAFFTFVGYLKDIFDDILGISDIDRGQLAQGSQLAADAVQQLQGASGQRQKLHTDIDKEGTILVGHLLISNIRQFYPSELTITVNDPAGAQRTMSWNAQAFTYSWALKIDAGSSSPGAKQSGLQQALMLYDRKIVDRPYVQGVADISDAASINDRMDKREEKLAAAGFTKEALGLNRKGNKVKEPLV